MKQFGDDFIIFKNWGSVPCFELSQTSNSKKLEWPRIFQKSIKSSQKWSLTPKKMEFGEFWHGWYTFRWPLFLQIHNFRKIGDFFPPWLVNLSDSNELFIKIAQNDLCNRKLVSKVWSQIYFAWKLGLEFHLVGTTIGERMSLRKNVYCGRGEAFEHRAETSLNVRLLPFHVTMNNFHAPVSPLVYFWSTLVYTREWMVRTARFTSIKLVNGN